MSDAPDFFQISVDALDTLKDPLLLILVGRLGGEVVVSAEEFAAIRPHALIMKMDAARHEYIFTMKARQ